MGFTLFEKAEKFGVYLVANFAEILRVALELQTVDVKDEQAALVVLDPVFVSLVETGDVVDADALLVLASPLLNLADEVRNRRAQINQNIIRSKRSE